MKIRAKAAGVLLPVLIVAGVLITTATGYWKTENTKQPMKYETGEFSGENNPADIRGSYSFSDLEEAFEVPVDTLAKAFGFTGAEDPAAVKIKEFEELYPPLDDLEVGTDSMRLFIALYKGLPYEPEVTTALPEPAFNILRKEGAAAPSTLELYESKVVSFADMDIHTDGEVSLDDTHEEEVEAVIKGKTTFAELLDWGLSADTIEGVLGMDMGARTMVVRDFCLEKEIEFSTVKEPLQALLDEM